MSITGLKSEKKSDPPNTFTTTIYGPNQDCDGTSKFSLQNNVKITFGFWGSLFSAWGGELGRIYRIIEATKYRPILDEQLGKMLRF